MKIGYVRGGRGGKEAREVAEICGRAVYFESGADKSDVDGLSLLPILSDGVASWNKWRSENRRLRPYFPRRFIRDGAALNKLDFSGCTVVGCDFDGVSFRGADLSGVDGKSATFSDCNFEQANLDSANFFNARFDGCNFQGATLESAFLARALFRRCAFAGANLRRAEFGETDFLSCSLSGAVGLSEARHIAGSTLDFATVGQRLPVSFLRGARVPEALMNSIAPSEETNLGRSCFISYSSKDEAFAEKLYRDLVREGVSCWFAPRDLAIGAETYDVIDQEISKMDRLLVVLSDNSIKSRWVKDEAMKAFAEERRRGKVVLVPIRLDNAPMASAEAWVKKVRDQRNIGDFVGWENRSRYRKALASLMEALKRD